MSTLELAEALGTEKHKDQRDLAGKPYIGHLKRVADKLTTNDQKIVGWLHDLLEDTDVTAQYLLRLGFTEDIVHAIQALTRLPGESKIDAVQRTIKNELATLVKIADVQDNMDLSRLPEVTERDLKRHAKYVDVLNILLEAKSGFDNSAN